MPYVELEHMKIHFGTLILLKVIVLTAIIPGLSSVLHAQISGCTDPIANNYNASATVNDGSCAYPPVTISSEESHNLPSGQEDTSGLIHWNGKFWMINDSGPTNMYGFEFDSVRDIEVLALGDVPKRDWEEITQDDTHIYIGDFGNNYGSSTSLRILKFDKKSLLEGNPEMEVIRFTYSDQTDLSSPGSNQTDFDCEAFIVKGDRIFLFTKQWASEKTGMYKLPNEPGEHVAERQGTYDVQGLVTGSVYLEKQRLLVFSGYSSDMVPFLYLFYDFEGDDFFGGNRRKIGLNLPGNFLGRGHQVEAITTLDGLTYYITNERFSISLLTFPQQIHKLDLSDLLGHYLADVVGKSHYKDSSIPYHFTLDQNYPNPFNPSTVIRYHLPGPERVTLTVTDILGRHVTTLVDGVKNTGTHTVFFDASHLSSGIYTCTLATGDLRFTRFMSLVR